MSAGELDGAAAARAAATAEAAPPGGILEGLSDTLASAREVLVGFFGLFSLEARRAGTTLMYMVACGALVAMLIVSAWLGLMGSLALHAVARGVSWSVAVGALSLTNLVVAVLVLLACKRMSRDLLFPATRRQLESNTAHAVPR